MAKLWLDGEQLRVVDVVPMFADDFGEFEQLLREAMVQLKAFNRAVKKSTRELRREVERLGKVNG